MLQINRFSTIPLNLGPFNMILIEIIHFIHQQLGNLCYEWIDLAQFH